jgi:hypothetical protein
MSSNDKSSVFINTITTEMNPSSANKGWHWGITIISVVIIECERIPVTFNIKVVYSDDVAIRESPTTVHIGLIIPQSEYTIIPGRTSSASSGEGISSLTSTDTTRTQTAHT